jgi:hypothetical protein
LPEGCRAKSRQGKHERYRLEPWHDP